jgi:hypothetical protein
VNPSVGTGEVWQASRPGMKGRRGFRDTLDTICVC